MTDYRIKTSSPYTHEIEVKKVYYKGILWWRKKVEEWAVCDIDGRVYDGKFPKLLPFKYFDKARLQIRKFNGVDLLPPNKYKHFILNEDGSEWKGTWG